ncbi:MAG TPA: circadian clock protein KaiC [Steroidobacteraceae bacterium]|nr:circadian clock protein KaiC [Steroidobacteraceae bacterium]
MSGETVDRLTTIKKAGVTAPPPDLPTLPKAPTGIDGLDEILSGGFPAGRPTLVCGSAGCGKTLLSMEFLVRGALEFDEPGAYISFEETEAELAQNVASLGFDVDALVEQGKLAFDHVKVERQEIEETGAYDLDGLFVRLGLAIDSVGARRVVLDTIESLFSGFSDAAVLRAELRRLFGWLKERGVTAVITGERGDGVLTRQGLEEYVSDCVILLDHRVLDQVSTRRLRVVKYRGTAHGTNEYPFLIDESGITVLPVTSLGLKHRASTERISTGIPRLDAMLGGQGYYRGSSILVSGTAGAGKTSLAAHFAAAVCARGERCLYLAFEESPDQIVRNMRSIGVDLGEPAAKGLLRLEASRPTYQGLEMHLSQIHRLVAQFDPHAVVIDPVSNLSSAGAVLDATATLLRAIDFLKSRGTTALLTNLTNVNAALESTDIGISSLIDTWIVLRDIEAGGERNRGLYVIKSRGMAHSNQIREFLITSEGIDLQDVYVGADGVLTGSLRAAQEARERAAAVAREQEAQRRSRELERRRTALEAQIRVLQAEIGSLEGEGTIADQQFEERSATIEQDRAAAALRRGADAGR